MHEIQTRHNHAVNYLATTKSLIKVIDKAATTKRQAQLTRENILSQHATAIQFSNAVQARLAPKIVNHLRAIPNCKLAIGDYSVTACKMSISRPTGLVEAQSGIQSWPMFLFTLVPYLSLHRDWSFLGVYNTHLPPQEIREEILQILDLAKDLANDLAKT